MTASSDFRGHPSIWLDGRWVYVDTHEEISASGGGIWPCVKCGESFAEHEPDPCLGLLPGVQNACCGHGIRERAYIHFTNGVVVGGFYVAEKLDDIKGFKQVYRDFDTSVVGG